MQNAEQGTGKSVANKIDKIFVFISRNTNSLLINELLLNYNDRFSLQRKEQDANRHILQGYDLVWRIR